MFGMKKYYMVRAHSIMHPRFLNMRKYSIVEVDSITEVIQAEKCRY